MAGFSYLNVLDIEQTEGEAIPVGLRPQNVETPEGFGWTIETLRELVLTIKGVAGIELRGRLPGDPDHAAGWFDQIVVVLSESPPALHARMPCLGTSGEPAQLHARLSAHR